MLGTGHDVGRCGGVGVGEESFRKRMNVCRIAMMFCMLGKMVTIQKMKKSPNTHTCNVGSMLLCLLVPQQSPKDDMLIRHVQV
jgi:hypothetical protein